MTISFLIIKRNLSGETIMISNGRFLEFFPMNLFVFFDSNYGKIRKKCFFNSVFLIDFIIRRILRLPELKVNGSCVLIADPL